MAALGRAVPPAAQGPFGVVCGYRLAGLAAYEQLDIATAEADLRTALALGQTVGIHSHGARLASALLGTIRYDLGDITGAEMLIDECAELGQESAVVEFKMATCGIGSRVKVLRGELDAAEAWLAEGAKIAEDLGLPRLAARIDNERVRIGLPLDPVTRAELLQIPPFPHQQNGLHALTNELRQDTAIRLLLTEHSPTATEHACARAESMAREIARMNRPRATLPSELLWATTLSASGKTAQAITVLAPVLELCAEHRLIRYIADEAPQLSL